MQISMTLEETLMDYIEEHCDGLDPVECIRKVRAANHGGFLEAVVRIWFTRPDPKKRLVWLHGERNSGKSEFIKCLEAIFCFQEFNFNLNYCVTEPPTQNIRPQIYTSKEFAVAHAFADANFSDLKSMFEGDGAHLSTNKFVKFEKMMVDGNFIVATNKLPDISRFMSPKYASEWLPLTARFEMVTLHDFHVGGTPMPYTTADLALALMFRVRGEPRPPAPLAIEP